MKTARYVMFILVLLVLATASIYVYAAPVKAKKITSKGNTWGEKPNVGTNFKFDDLTVHGQYQSANEGLVTVENEKELSNLLDYRTDYKDRLNHSRLNP